MHQGVNADDVIATAYAAVNVELFWPVRITGLDQDSHTDLPFSLGRLRW